MAKRFFDTHQIYYQEYNDLSLKIRELLRWAESTCDLIGVFSFSEKIVSAFIGVPISENDVLKIPGVIKLKNGRFFLSNFCKNQYGKLSEKATIYGPCIKSFNENNLTGIFNLDNLEIYPIDRVYDTPMDKYKEKDKDKEKEKEAKKIEKKFTPPELSEVHKFFSDEGFPVALADHVFKYYSEADPPWTDSRGTPVKSWKQKFRSVWMKIENKNFNQIIKNQNNDKSNNRYNVGENMDYSKNFRDI